ncbi:hypothetical protein PVAP13_5NG080720 [Panicum virgatum]|uniref:Uncharacterized protein n=1 Tax=Panicum virgatum TaxID=38727 RepID=A0A8T0RNY4_PANVG|nr:hypothetical protein PVAP13_5NG080720 [Panicum virgatum]
MAHRPCSAPSSTAPAAGGAAPAARREPRPPPSCGAAALGAVTAGRRGRPSSVSARHLPRSFPRPLPRTSARPLGSRPPRSREAAARPGGAAARPGSRDEAVQSTAVAGAQGQDEEAVCGGDAASERGTRLREEELGERVEVGAGPRRHARRSSSCAPATVSRCGGRIRTLLSRVISARPVGHGAPCHHASGERRLAQLEPLTRFSSWRQRWPAGARGRSGARSARGGPRVPTLPVWAAAGVGRGGEAGLVAPAERGLGLDGVGSELKACIESTPSPFDRAPPASN